MNLEDHLGDIIHKARLMNSVSAGAAAKAAGLTEAGFSQLEADGQTTETMNITALATLIGLNADKLLNIAEGWLPTQPDLSTWRELRTFTTTAEGITVNCYLIWDEATHEAALFDTGWEAQPILECIAANQLRLSHLFITHSHRDHVVELGTVRAAHSKARVHTNSRHAPLEQRNKPNEISQLGGLRITYRETPGHAEDGVTYLVGNWPDDAPHVAIVGDAIFAGSMGRGNQSWELARRKVREEILSLPESTLICPGHGPVTTVKEQREHNPFF